MGVREKKKKISQFLYSLSLSLCFFKSPNYSLFFALNSSFLAPYLITVSLFSSSLSLFNSHPYCLSLLSFHPRFSLLFRSFSMCLSLIQLITIFLLFSSSSLSLPISLFNSPLSLCVSLSNSGNYCVSLIQIITVSLRSSSLSLSLYHSLFNSQRVKS
ncbi:unnamed protein product [Acanthosepion pharaonis]|uniref:Transmembrane protein n=1 Tax=Acanthosepion pharaonis TaxID=158019 RepID=A0A812AZZ2_ACAPH|nr:unnamed protein product [Sepia pharaonis]